MSTSERPIMPALCRRDSLRDKLFDFSILLVGTIACVMAAWTITDSPARAAWAIVLVIYFIFYRRVAYVVFWARDTYCRIGATVPSSEPGEPDRQEHALGGTSPRFHVLVAAYNASDSIGPVIRALAQQDYPRDRYDAWIITSHRETAELGRRRESVAKRLSQAKTVSDVDPQSASLLWWSESLRAGDLKAWIHAIRAGALRRYLTIEGADSLVMRDLLGRLLGAPERYSRFGTLRSLGVTDRHIRYIEAQLARVQKQTGRVMEDFERLLGPSVYAPEEIEGQLLAALVRRRRTRKIGQCIVQHLAAPLSVKDPPPWSRLKGVADLLLRSTHRRVSEVIDECGSQNIHHLDSRSQGYKPGALNAAFKHIQERGLFHETGNTFFIVIDSDSLLPAHALHTLAAEIQRMNTPAVMQMVSIPTANFFCSGWYSRFVSFTDAVGAVGKWARSTRRQLRPDLAAGSGVVVPASLATYIAKRVGAPWAETTITEDARLIIGQFGLTHGARAMTTMAPVYLLEAVPAGGRLSSTYRSYWNQRRRWTIGGYDEFFYMLRAPDWVKYARFDSVRKCWVEWTPKSLERMATRLRQYYRAARWGWDHFWWGLGSALILMHWSLVSLTIAEPSRAVFLVGLSGLVLLPLVFLLLVGRRLSQFIPGGLSRRSQVVLYFLAFPAIWLYVLPVVWTQLACVFRRRTAELDWRPTQKPRFDVLIPGANLRRPHRRAAATAVGEARIHS